MPCAGPERAALPCLVAVIIASLRVCTIVACNYLPHARVLARSFRAHHPGGEVTTLVIDDLEGVVEASKEPFEVLRPEDLGVDRFEAMAAMYEVTELATAVKPWLLRKLLAKGDPVAYVDPDIRFFAAIDDLEPLARSHGLVLTPHLTAALPRDGQQPDDLHILASGVFNLGFVALAPGDSAEWLLDWWSERVRFDCVIDHGLGLFVDQRWFDLVPGMLPSTWILRDPGVNVAYWNLHERRVELGDGTYTAAGSPLRFFHFSGYDVRRPDSLSRHQTRIRLEEEPVLATICDDYRAALLDEGYTGHDTGPPFSRLGDGQPLTRLLRRAYRDGEKQGAFRLSPFTAAGAEELYAWLRSPVTDEAGVETPRVLGYGENARLAAIGPPPSHGPGFRPWLEAFEADEPPAPAGVPGAGEPTGQAVTSTGAPWGVNVAGYLQAELGVGEAGRAVIAGLDAQRVPLLPVQVRPAAPSRHAQPFGALEAEAASFPINIVCANADVLPQFAEAAPEFFRGRHTIGLWFWEVDCFPQRWRSSFELVDELWAATDHIAEALRPVATVDVHRVRIPVVVPQPPARTRAQLGMPEGFVFLFSFDYDSVFERKNPLGLIDAFRLAFPPGSGASLVIKSINHERHPDAREALTRVAAEHPDVRIVEGYVSGEEKNAMIAACDCYVSLHRAEGFGFGCAEAMYLGRPVIATRYSGNLDFMSSANSLLVDCELRPIGDGHSPYPPEGRWADPDLEHAAHLMQGVVGDQAAAKKLGARGAHDIRQTHSVEAAGKTMAARLPAIRTNTGASPAGQTAHVRLDELRRRVDSGPAPSPASTAAQRLKRLLRPVALRLMRVYTAHQEEIDRRMTEAVQDLHAELARMHSRHGAELALVLAELRRSEQHRATSAYDG